MNSMVAVRKFYRGPTWFLCSCLLTFAKKVERTVAVGAQHYKLTRAQRKAKQIKKHHHQCDNACIDHTHTDIKKHAALAQMTMDVDV